ncbi:MAG: aspartate kinase [Defluviitaleaceae bacterium]|nr:aspartate kinase [Defluviitaleaceae bacterium]
MLIVQKYGGTSVANAERINNAACRITDAYRAGNRVIVVVSAQGSMTDSLLEKAREVNPEAGKRELDMLLSTGEQQSAALMAMAIQRLGYSAVSLNAAQVGIESTSLYGNAQIKNVKTKRISHELERGNIVIVTGFQGVNRFDDITTLGRGASDTTAVALAAVFGAGVCEICTDVDGIYTADPRIVTTARKLKEIGYEAMLELTASGLQKPHNRAVEMAKRFGVRLLVRSSFSDAPGTWIKEDSDVEQLSVSGLVVDRDVARVSVTGLADKPGTAFNVFSKLAREGISAGMILQSAVFGEDISFTVRKRDLAKTGEVLEANKENIGYDKLATDENLAKLTVVGAGMASNSGVAAALFEALYDNGVNIHMISTSEIKIQVLVDHREVGKATKAVHDKFELLLESEA